ncbi:MAG TPA: aminoacyl-histidine dipeptidase [Ignavibacteriaceae bacterium]|nr:aminoacyl-histidine dipeptidase [Ignavibacteriaceae bacterium]
MSDSAIKGLKPEILWKRFYEISQVPRPSKKEEKILDHLKKLAAELGLEYKQDKVGNIVFKVPATKGYEKSPTVIIQGHVDMVCEKNKSKKHDFENEPITLLKEDGWITADGTTLGSDNGIGVAAGLAVVTDKDVVHGPLELLMTVDEETGLTGATNLKKGMIEGKILLNLDSEEDGAFYVGCSGGVDTVAEFKLDLTNAPSGTEAYNVLVTGLKGGHSGLDIQAGRGNAIKILARALKELEKTNFAVSTINGGSLRNAIPREAEATIFIKKSDAGKVKKIINDFYGKILNEFKTADGGLKIEFTKAKDPVKKVFKKKFAQTVTDTLLALPHGVIAMSQDIEGLVETSTNLATIITKNKSVVVGTSQRSSINSANQYIAKSVGSIFSLAGAKYNTTDGYPGWKPNLDSKILKISKEVFHGLFNKEPEIKAIHAGLECGILEGKSPGLDMVSFGPTIEGAHSPDERINIKTVEKFYDLLKGILKRVAMQN